MNEKKQIYETPVAEVVSFESNDSIASSGGIGLYEEIWQ